MVNRIWSALFCLIVAGAIGSARAQNPAPAQTTPDITGKWTGTWYSYNPAQGTATQKELCKNLSCNIEYKDGAWQATFEGDCGRPYKYEIKMEGRQVGKAVMFKGTSDLGAQDGGVYDWIGRANDKEFVGFFTSAFYTGTFSLSRAK